MWNSLIHGAVACFHDVLWAGTLSALLIDALGVTLQDYSHLWDLTLITALAKLCAIPFVVLVPRDIVHAKQSIARSRCGAMALAVGLCGGTVPSPYQNNRYPTEWSGLLNSQRNRDLPYN